MPRIGVSKILAKKVTFQQVESLQSSSQQSIEKSQALSESLMEANLNPRGEEEVLLTYFHPQSLRGGSMINT